MRNFHTFNQHMLEKIEIDISVGDTILGGKFKNKRIVVKEIGRNEKGDLTINGRSLMRFRLIDNDLDDIEVNGKPLKKLRLVPDND